MSGQAAGDEGIGLSEHVFCRLIFRLRDSSHRGSFLSCQHIPRTLRMFCADFVQPVYQFLE